MIEIKQGDIINWATDAGAVGKAKGLIGKFSNLKRDKDKTIIWGECAGSGKNPYYTSVDFVDESNPVFRCNCPSRQIPCKHALGLLLVYEKGVGFVEGDIPEDILSKRQKISARVERKDQEKELIKEKSKKPKKININAARKKTEIQLAGIENAQKILNALVQMGISTINVKEKKNVDDQIKELGNYYISGIQTSFNDLMLEIDYVKNDNFSPVINQINYLATLLRKASQYLSERRENPETSPEVGSAIEEQIGTIWKLTELMQMGLYQENIEMLQLAFFSEDDEARRAFIETGVWLDLKSGKIYRTKNYRPYRATKYIKEENSQNRIFKIKDLFIYPGDVNPRIRWEGDAAEKRTIEKQDLSSVMQFAQGDFAKMMTEVKATIKNPLMEKHPFVLLKLHKSHVQDGVLVLEDAHNNSLPMSVCETLTENTTRLLQTILPEDCSEMGLLVQIQNDVRNGIFAARPMTLVTQENILKLLF